MLSFIYRKPFGVEWPTLGLIVMSMSCSPQSQDSGTAVGDQVASGEADATAGASTQASSWTGGGGSGQWTDSVSATVGATSAGATSTGGSSSSDTSLDTEEASSAGIESEESVGDESDCLPNCDMRVCGPDPECQRSCGTCSAGESCNDGRCECTPDCSARNCGPDPVCGQSCGTCMAGEACTGGTCVASDCEPDCSGLSCGADPKCGQDCGSCEAPESCAEGSCACVPHCAHRTCGLEPSCGTSCGFCEGGQLCLRGSCRGGDGQSCWTRHQAATEAVSAHSVELDAAGDIVLVGETEKGVLGNDDFGGWDLFVAKYNQDSQRIWARQLGTGNWDHAAGVATHTDGSLVVAGRVSGALPGHTQVGKFDISVHKFDAEGQVLWSVQHGSQLDDDAKGIAVDLAGDVYVIGETKNALDGEVFLGRTDIFVVKFSGSDGTWQWTRMFGTSETEGAGDLVVGPSGDIFALGWTGGIIEGNDGAGFIDLALARYTPAGAKLWVRQFGSQGNDFGHDIIADPAGNLYIGGATAYELAGKPIGGSLDAFVLKVNSEAQRSWAQTFGTDDIDYAQGLAIDGAGHVHVAGSSGGLPLHHWQFWRGDEDILHARLAPDGSIEHFELLGSLEAEVGRDIAVDAGGHAYLVGHGRRWLDGRPALSATDAFLTRICP